MHKLYELKEMLCKELEEYGSKDKLDVGSLDVVDKLAHAVKNIDKIIECKEEYSYADGDMMSRRGRGGSYGRGYYEGTYEGSYARGRGSNARRDSMGRYSRDENEFRMELKELIENAPNERIKMKMKEVMSEM